jgi:hypothetical protein
MADANEDNFRPTLWSEGNHPLEPKETQRLAAALGSGEQALETVRGRMGGKAHLWSLTNRRLLAVGMGWLGRSTPVALDSIRDIEEQEGVHGTTIQLDLASGARLFLVAVAPTAAHGFVAALSERARTPSRFVPSRKVRPAPLVAAPPYRAPAAPMSNPAADEMLAELQRLAAMHSAGQLTEGEFIAAQKKLLLR